MAGRRSALQAAVGIILLLLFVLFDGLCLLDSRRRRQRNHTDTLYAASAAEVSFLSGPAKSICSSFRWATSLKWPAKTGPQRGGRCSIGPPGPVFGGRLMSRERKQHSAQWKAKVGVARRAHDPRIASQRDPLIARVTIGQEFADEPAGHEEVVRPIAVPADREVEDVDRHGQAAVGPHLARDVLARFGPGGGKDLVDPPRFRVVSIHRGDFRRQQERHSRLVRADRSASEHFAAKA